MLSSASLTTRRRSSCGRVTQEEAVDAFGSDMYDMLYYVLDLLWEPDQMNERMIVTATRFYQY
jgi:hypothetical protein